MITLVAGMIVSSSCSLFLVFHIWVSIVVVSLRISFFVFCGSDKDDIVRICCNVAILCEGLIMCLEILSNFFVSITVNVKMSYILCFAT